MSHVPDSARIRDGAREDDELEDRDSANQDNEITSSLSFLTCMTCAKSYGAS